MSDLVRSSEFGVWSKDDKVRSRGTRLRVAGVRSKDDIAGTLKFILILFAFIICNFSITEVCASEPPLRTASSSSSPFDEIKKTYAEIKTLEAQFNQKIFISSLKKERESKGEFFFKRQKGFLWRYKEPKVQYFLYDGKFIWQGEDDKPFILKDKIDKEKTGGTFFDLIEDIAKIDELFTIKEQKIIEDLEVLELLPKKEGTVNSAKVWIDKQKRIKKIEIYEFTGNINTIEFSGIKVNQPLDDGKFVFKRDGSKEIVER
jgi:outer membrane lipoprotein-sorting protein